jgi:hypothetical protein
MPSHEHTYEITIVPHGIDHTVTQAAIRHRTRRR